jgi:hypothetical protein
VGEPVGGPVFTGAGVGGTAGLLDGAIVGIIVGREEGSFVVILVGDKVEVVGELVLCGAAVGRAIGWREGPLVGAMVGVVIGTAVGAFVGGLVGEDAFTGEIVGRPDGLGDGLLVGTLAGGRDGALLVIFVGDAVNVIGELVCWGSVTFCTEGLRVGVLERVFVGGFAGELDDPLTGTGAGIGCTVGLRDGAIFGD